ncbi:hypothetical protein AB0H73_08805 [Streptomyces olivoreticuli]
MRKLRNTVAVLAAATALGGLGISTAVAAPPAAPARIMESPTPDCADRGGRAPCYEYRTWFWTFANCEEYVRNHEVDPAKYNGHVCAVFTNGATVGLWYHKYRD